MFPQHVPQGTWFGFGRLSQVAFHRSAVAARLKPQRRRLRQEKHSEEQGRNGRRFRFAVVI